MPTFLPSRHSPGNPARMNSSAGPSPVRMLDEKGVLYSIVPDGTITMIEAAYGLPANSVFPRSDKRWKGMITNLAAVSEPNKQALFWLLGADVVAATIGAASTALPVPATAPADAVEVVPTIGEKPPTPAWLWPAVAGVTLLVCVGGYYYYTTQRSSAPEPEYEPEPIEPQSIPI